MAKIRFETGQVVNVEGNPTAADIEEIAAQLGIKNQTAPTPENKTEYWNTLSQDPDFQALPLQEKKIVRGNYFNPQGSQTIVMEPELPEEIMQGELDAQRQQREQLAQKRHEEFSKIDPNWRNLRNPQIIKQATNEDLLNIMKTQTPFKELKREFFKEPEQKGGSVRNKAYRELTRRGFDKNTLIYLLEGESPTFGGQLLQNAPEDVASTIGSIIGYAKFGIKGAAAGAAVGGAVGKAGKQAWYKKIGDIRAPETFGQAAREIGLEATLQGVLDLTGAGVEAVGRKAIGMLPLPSGVGASVTERMPIEDAMQVYKTAKRFDIPLTAGDISQRPLYRSATALSAQGAFTKGKFAKLEIKKVKGIQGMEKAIRSQFVGDVDRLAGKDLANLLGNAIDEKRALWSAYENELWDDVVQSAQEAIVKRQTTRKTVVQKPTPFLDASGKPLSITLPKTVTETSPEALVDLSPMIQDAKKTLEKIAAINEEKLGAGAIGYKESAGDLLRQFAERKTNKIDFGLAQDLRSFLIKARDQFATDKSVAIGNVKQMIGSITDSMGKTAQNLGPDVHAKWKFARSFTSMKHAKLEDEMLRTAFNKIKKDPDALGSLIFQADRPERVLKLRKMMGAERWKNVQSSAVDKLLGDSYTKLPEFTEPFVDGAKLSKNLTKWKGTLSKTLNKEQISALQKLARVAEAAQSTSKTLGVGLGTLQSGPMSKISTGKLDWAIAAALSVPGIVGDLVANSPTTLKRIAAAEATGDIKTSKLLFREMLSKTTTPQFTNRAMKIINKTPDHLLAATALRLAREGYELKQKKKRSEEKRVERTPSMQQLRGFGGRGY